MNYERIYRALILKRQLNKLSKKGSVYCEEHHIIPKCLNGDNSKSNLVNLTAKEHFVAHRLLWKWLKHPKLFDAIFYMANVFINNKKIKISSRLYETLRKEISLKRSKCPVRESGKYKWCHNVKTGKNRLILKTDSLPDGHEYGMKLSKAGLESKNKKVKENTKRYDYMGKTYTLRELAGIRGLPYKTLIHRLQSMPLEQALSLKYHKKRNIYYNGENMSISKFSKKTGIPRTTIYQCAVKGMSVEEILAFKKQEAILYEYNGYRKTIKEWAECSNIPEPTFRHRLKIGWTIKDAIEKPVKLKKLSYIVNGKTYSLNELAKEKNINVGTLRDRIQTGMSVEQAISANKRKARKYEYDGKLLTIEEWSKILGISIGCIYKRLKKNWSFKQIAETASKRKMYTYNGETHLLADWSKILGIPAERLYYRLKAGYSTEKAFQQELK